MKKMKKKPAWRVRTVQINKNLRVCFIWSGVDRMDSRDWYIVYESSPDNWSDLSLAFLYFTDVYRVFPSGNFTC